MNVCLPKYEFEERIVKVQKIMQREGYDVLLSYGNEAEPQ